MELPREEERERARDVLHKLVPLRSRRAVHVRYDEPERQVDVVLPACIFDALLELLRHTAEGNAVTLVLVHAELTTQQASDLLNVSRPHLVRLLEGGAIPFHRTGRDRRVYAKDLFAYRDRRRDESREAFEELAALSQDHDLGY